MPWLWFKPIWYASGKGFRFDRLVKLTRDFSLKVWNHAVFIPTIVLLKVIQERRRWIEEEGIEDEGMVNCSTIIFVNGAMPNYGTNIAPNRDKDITLGIQEERVHWHAPSSTSGE